MATSEAGETRSRPSSAEGKGPNRGPSKPRTERQRRLRRRALPLAVVAFAAFIFGAVSSAGSPEADLAEEFVRDWAAQDFPAMHDKLTDAAKEQYPLDQFAAAYGETQTASTATAIDPGGAGDPDGGLVEVEVGVRTEIFDRVEGAIALPISGQEIAWAPHHAFPGLQEGERLGRRLTLGNRAAILARDGTPLAEGQGAGRSSPLGDAAIDVAGEVGEPDAERRAEMQAAGYPGDQPTGVSGIELGFNSRLAGRPGGELLAVPEGSPLPDVPKRIEGRTLATAEQAPGEPVRTTIDPDLQRVTVGALGGRSGGIAVLNAKNGQVRALAGQAFSSLQPPGSTMKVITATAALEEKKAKLDDTFPVVQEINAGGRVIANANEEFCGGTFVESFAHSCNTVFAPLGVEIGEEKFVETAERYGFNQMPTLYNAEATEAVGLEEPTIPKDPGDDVDLAASAIGQGQVLATALSMASVAQTIAAGGIRSPTPLVADPALRADAEPVEVTDRENARVIRSLMERVVNDGTGGAASLGSRIQVAGKTGTAELGPDPDAPEPKPPPPGEDPPKPVQILDAWFIAFAPSAKPRLAVGVMLVDSEADGGEVAAPVAREILSAGL